MSKPKAKARSAKQKPAARKAKPALKKAKKAVVAKRKPAPAAKKPSRPPVKSNKPKPAKLKRAAAPTHGKPVKATPAPKLVKPAAKLLKAATKPAKPAPKLANPEIAKRKSAEKTPSGQSIMESAQHIWLAGLGAFSKAQEEGGRLFENLIREGTNLEQHTRKIATGKAGNLRGAVESSVNQVRERTQETWDRLEQVFEDRVSRALSKLGVPGRKELDELLQRVEELSARVTKLRGAPLRASLGQTIGSGMRRARDDLSDLARELEEAQHAAKLSMKRSVAKVKKSIKDAAR